MERVVLAVALVLFSSGVRYAMAALGEESFDASDVSWAHAVNSRKALDKALKGAADFIESDVTLGVLTGANFNPLMPVLAHPPDTSSDLSLDDLCVLVTGMGEGKGVKLDFKSIEVVEPSFVVLKKYAEKMNFTLWLNADILAGPILASSIPVKADTFLLLCNQYFPSAVLSIGWTTEWYSTYPEEQWHYDWNQVRKMADTIRCFGYENKYPTYTFPVRAVFASKSIRQLQWLLGVIPRSSLTVWSALGDYVGLEDLMQIRNSFDVSKVYYDIPDILNMAFMRGKNTTKPYEETTSFKKNQWITYTHGAVAECGSFTYTTNSIIVFGHSLTTVVLLKRLITIDDLHSFKAQGKVRFFHKYGEMVDTSLGHKLTISVVDVSLFSKNSSADSMDLSESDTDILWTAMNASKVHTFEQNTLDQCRIFKLDSEADKSFQAWTVPCYEMDEKASVDEIAMSGMSEVPFNKRLVLPKGPFMIGFMSSGEGHVVIHDFEITDKKEKIQTNASSTLSVTMGVLTVLFLCNVVRRITSC